MNEANKPTDERSIVQRLRDYDPDVSNAYVVREAADLIEKLTAVAVAARTLSRTAQDWGNQCAVAEEAMVALESALAAAGYDMTEAEFEERIANE